MSDILDVADWSWDTIYIQTILLSFHKIQQDAPPVQGWKIVSWIGMANLNMPYARGVCTLNGIG